MTETNEQPGGPSAEERAEELMERVGADVSRFVTRAVARAREEIEDVVAEAQSLRRGERPPGTGSGAAD